MPGAPTTEPLPAIQEVDVSDNLNLMVDLCNGLSALSMTSESLVGFGDNTTLAASDFDLALVSKTMHLAHALVEHHQVEGHEDAVEIASAHVLSVDVGTQIGASALPRRPQLTPAELAQRVRTSMSFLLYCKFDSSVRLACLHAVIAQQVDDNLPIVVP